MEPGTLSLLLGQGVLDVARVATSGREQNTKQNLYISRMYHHQFQKYTDQIISAYLASTLLSTMAFHPLRDLTASEIKQAASLIRQLHRGQKLVFKAITLEEPQKDLVIKYFRAQENGTPLPAVPRIVFAAYYFEGTVRQHSCAKLRRYETDTTTYRTALLPLMSTSLTTLLIGRKE